jgi:hypothetical protein
MARQRDRFDPRAILAALERNYVNYVLIGGLAQVLRGTDLSTSGVDICPSFSVDNIDRLVRAAGELEARRVDGRPLALNEEAIASESLIALTTTAGGLQIIGAPAGAPNGFADLRRAASTEHLGEALQPLVASTGDLARMAAALHRAQDLKRLPQLRQIIELEADREQTLRQPTDAPRSLARTPARRTGQTPAR